MANDITSAQYIRTCPVCLTEYEKPIFSDGMWHCRLCGILHYSPEYRVEIDKLLENSPHREIFITFVRKEWKRTNMPVDINPQIVKKVLREHQI